MRRSLIVPVILAVLPLAACQSTSWTEQCETKGERRSCEISVSGTGSHEMPFPVSGRLSAKPERFSLASASPDGEAVFSMGRTGEHRCRQGARLTVGDSEVTCLEVGDGSLRFSVTRG